MFKDTPIQKIIVFIIAAAVLFGGGFFVGQNTAGTDKATTLNLDSLFGKDNVEFSLIKDAWDIIHEKYVASGEINDRELIFGAIKGMVDALGDPYTVFFNETETEQFKTSVSGKFEGVGIEISIKEERLTVVSPLKGTPAARAGVKAGDVIVAIDGESTEGITLEEAVSKIRGPGGTEVVLTMERAGEENNIDIPVVRDVIEVPSVVWEMTENNIAYVEITQFSEITARDFDKIAREILKSKADRIVLDLRNNPGGFLNKSIEITGWFLEEGTLIVTEERGRGAKIEHTSPGPGSLADLPVVVLINEGSASASEIVAGALRDRRDVPVVGEKSFGKGSVQSFQDLSAGTSLKITIARWITPSGQHINGEGIAPTIKVELTSEDVEAGRDPQRERAIEVVKTLR